MPLPRESLLWHSLIQFIGEFGVMAALALSKLSGKSESRTGVRCFLVLHPSSGPDSTPFAVAMSEEPLDTPLKSNGGCINVSSGQKVHEYTSWSAMESIFAFLDSMVTPISASKIDKILAIQRGDKVSRRKSAAADTDGAADGVSKSDNENGANNDGGESTGESSGKISKRKERAKSRLSIPPMATPPPDDNIFSPRSTSDE
jgi:hypothetical protein